MIKHRDVLNDAFQKEASNEQVDFIKVAYVCNEMSQDSNILPLKGGEQDVKHLQQSTSVLETRCQCKRVQSSKRKQQSSVKNKAWVPQILVFGFQRVHGNGKDTWSRVNASTKQEKLKITTVTVCKVRQFLSFL